MAPHDKKKQRFEQPNISNVDPSEMILKMKFYFLGRFVILYDLFILFVKRIDIN